MLYHPERLDQCDPDLVAVFTSVGQKQDIVGVFGARSVADEQTAIDTGHSHLHNPLDSKHVIAPPMRPYAEAGDIAPYTGNPAAPVNWDDKPGFVALAAVVKAEAARLGIQIVWGGDWGWDFDHYELVHPHVVTPEA